MRAAKAPKPISVFVGRVRTYCLTSPSSGIRRCLNNSCACIVVQCSCPRAGISQRRHGGAGLCAASPGAALFKRSTAGAAGACGEPASSALTAPCRRRTEGERARAASCAGPAAVPAPHGPSGPALVPQGRPRPLTAGPGPPQAAGTGRQSVALSLPPCGVQPSHFIPLNSRSPNELPCSSFACSLAGFGGAGCSPLYLTKPRRQLVRETFPPSCTKAVCIQYKYAEKMHVS